MFRFVKSYFFRQPKNFVFFCVILYLTFLLVSALTIFSVFFETKKLNYEAIQDDLVERNIANIEVQSKESNENNKFKQECVLPKLEVIGHTDTVQEKLCFINEDWGYLKENKWYYINRIQEKINNNLLTCKYRKIIRLDDFKYSYTKWFELNHNQTILDDVIEVECKNSSLKNSVEYNNLLVQIVNKLNESQINDKTKETNEQCNPMNILLISYDSVSRSSWFKRAPKTTSQVLDKMKFVLLNGYNIVGDGTPAALIPIYTGSTEEELPSVLKNDPKGRYVDEAYPFIWKELHEKNYITFHMDDWPQVSAFTFRMRGFLNHTAKHYFRQYQLKLWQRVFSNYIQKKDDFCIGAKKRHKVFLDLITDFKRTYKNRANNLAIMHYCENSHDANKHFNWVDNDLFDFLKTGSQDGLFDNTAIFLFSDHGSRFVDKRSSKNRYLEERLPFFAVYVPESFKEAYPEKYNNLIVNSNLLTSPFDIHATIRDLTCLDTDPESYDDNYRSISLFKKISPDRNCDSIGISDHYCTCEQEWTKKSTSDEKILNAVKFSIASINEITNPVRNLCLLLDLLKIISAETLLKNEHILYRIQFITYPNNGIYESLLVGSNVDGFEFKSIEFSIKSRNEISRIDAYGLQPYCVSNFGKNPSNILDLRKFCYCKPKRKISKTTKFLDNESNEKDVEKEISDNQNENEVTKIEEETKK